ncbi:hypothetical protein GCM10010182_79430 [Actinomadura cremea]|nr:hypothetical protein GCM10010182_79430 [Actinomadura cremea]
MDGSWRLSGLRRSGAPPGLRAEARRWATSKYAERGGSGEFTTIHPADERVLEQALRELGGMLEGQRAPIF